MRYIMGEILSSCPWRLLPGDSLSLATPFWYQRDFIHANARGKQALGRLLLEYFHPDDKFWAVNR